MKTLKQTLQKLNWLVVAQLAIVALIAFAPLVVPTHRVEAAFVDQFLNNCPSDTGVRCDGGSVSSIFKLIINWAIAIAFIAAVIILIYGAFLYITSAGNEDNSKKGKTAIINAIIGIVILLLSYVIVQIVFRFVGGTGGGITGL